MPLSRPNGVSKWREIIGIIRVETVSQMVLSVLHQAQTSNSFVDLCLDDARIFIVDIHRGY